MNRVPIEDLREKRRKMTLLAQERKIEEEKFYAAIGRALTIWSSVEDALCYVYCRAISRGEWTYTEKAYWAVVSFEARLKITDRLVKARLEGRVAALAEWLTIHDLIRDHNTERNKLAHGSVLQMPYSNSRMPEPKIDLFFAPYFWSRSRSHFRKVRPINGKLDGRPKERLYLPDIHGLIEKFTADVKLLQHRAVTLVLEAQQAERP
jgi:hypothetical protein